MDGTALRQGLLRPGVAQGLRAAGLVAAALQQPSVSVREPREQGEGVGTASASLRALLLRGEAEGT